MDTENYLWDSVCVGLRKITKVVGVVAEGTEAVAEGIEAATLPSEVDVSLRCYIETEEDDFVVVKKNVPNVIPVKDVELFVEICQLAAAMQNSTFNEVGLRRAAYVWYFQEVYERSLTPEESRIAGEFKRILLEAPPDCGTFASRYHKLEAAANAYAQGIPK